MTEVQLDIDALKREGTELARYRLSTAERLVIGRRGCGGAELIDVPASGEGRAYQIDSGWQDDAALETFVSEYVAQAECMDECPMSAAALGILVDNTESDEVEELLAAVWRC